MKKPWWQAVTWSRHVSLQWVNGVPTEIHPQVYAECQGPMDPCCGTARFSAHGCNGGRPSRVEFLQMLADGKATITFG